MIREYREIAEKNYNGQRAEVIAKMNAVQSKEIKFENLIFLGLIGKDYRKIMME